MIGIINYGIGNIYSIYTSIKKSFGIPFIVDKPENLKMAKFIILPGVGAFDDGIRNLTKTGIADAIKEEIKKGKYFLGICLGLQLLFSESEEGKNKGLNIIKGKVNKFLFKKDKLNIPHMGWNRVEIIKKNSRFFNGIPQNSYFYFAHSYYVSPEDKSKIIGITKYGINFPSVIEYNNVIGVQFHPEKSGEFGLIFLKNFLKNGN